MPRIGFLSPKLCAAASRCISNKFPTSLETASRRENTQPACCSLHCRLSTGTTCCHRHQLCWAPGCVLVFPSCKGPSSTLCCAVQVPARRGHLHPVHG